MEDVQAAWLLLTFRVATRAKYWLRTVPPEFRHDYAEMHDRSVTRCLEQILHMGGIPQHIWESASMPLTLGGLGVGGASRMCDAAHWGSCADCLEMMKNWHLHIAHAILRGLASRTPGYLRAVQESRDRLRDMGVEVPSWEALAEGLRPKDVDIEPEPSQPNHGWQMFASVTIQTVHRQQSKQCDHKVVPFTAMPTSRVTRIASDPDSLVATLPLSFALCVRSCRCGRFLDVLRHHHAACSTGGAFGRRVFAAESAVAQICREGGARVSLNAMLAKKGRTPSCTRATAVRVWWSLQEKSGAGGLKRPRRSCGRWLAPRRRQCRDGCTAVPEPLGTGGAHASWLALRRRQWLAPGKEGSPGAGDQVPSVNEVVADGRFLV